MKKIIKKRNLGMILGLFLFIIALLYYSFQFISFKQAKKELDVFFSNYITDMNTVGVGITPDNSSDKKEQYKDIIDKYWTEEDNDLYSQNDEELNTMADLKTAIFNALESNNLESIGTLNSSYYSFNLERIDSKNYEMYVNINTSINAENYEGNYISIYGPTYFFDQSPHEYITVQFRKEQGSWQIVGITASDSNESFW